MAFTYLLKCRDGTLYCGSCMDMDKRLKQHNGVLKGGAKYTRGRRPVALVYKKKFKKLAQALQRERQIKKLTRKQKLILLLPHKTRTITVHGRGKYITRRVSKVR